MTRREPRALGLAGLTALLLASLSACPAQPRPPARAAQPATTHPARPAHAPELPAPAQPDRVRIVVAVADLAGDRDRQVKQRVLAHLHAFASGAADPAASDPAAGTAGSAVAIAPADDGIGVLDLPRALLAQPAGDALSPLDAVKESHDRARALLAETGAGVLIWGTAGAADAPVLYVTTAESSRWPCDRDPVHSSEEAPAATGHVLCALDTGATWLLCATAWSRIVPVGCAPAP